MNASIITIGDEILIGQIVDTNSAWIAQELEKIGVKVLEMRSISDNKIHISNTLDCVSDKVELVIITGGLGPTSDDITKSTLCEYFGGEMIRNKNIEEHIIKLSHLRGLAMLERNLQQADVPNNCEVLFNDNGTAPGMWFEKNNTVFVSLPGVPFEMKQIMSKHVLPLIKSRFKLTAIYHRTLLTRGYFESVLADKLIDFEAELNKRVKLAYLPSPECIKLRLSSQGDKYSEIKNLVDLEADKLYSLLEQSIYGEGDEKLTQAIAKLLIAKNMTIATAESCSGGTLASLITADAGCSKYFYGSIVAYSNEIKRDILNVEEEKINKYGAVSQQVAEAMAKNVQKLYNSSFGIATTGIAGPEGGSALKPIGTVWIAVADNQDVIAKKYVFSQLRDINIIRTSYTALEMLRNFILTKK